MPAPPTRRWFQFRLRTLLIVLTVLAIFFGYCGRDIQTALTRRALIASQWCERADARQNSDGLSLIRRWLADKKWETIYIPAEAPLDVRLRFEKAFPEAVVFYDDGKKD